MIWCHDDEKGNTICLACNKNIHSNPINCSSTNHLILYNNLKRKQNQDHITKRRTNPIWHEKQTHSQRTAWEKLRLEVLTHYGGRCVCCGYFDLNKRIHGKAFLQIDHLNGDGNKHRKEIRASNIYGWIKKNHYPAIFRVLCRGCNNSMEPREY